MATSIFFGGRRINVPQAAAVVDASELAGVSASAVGIVALIGTAEGGKPLTVDSTYSDYTQPGKMLAAYRSGNLRTAGQFAFEPSLDDAVPGGAQRIVAVKVNPAVQSSITLLDGSGGNSITLTSVDWGLFTNQINVQVATGTTQGKKVTIVFEDETEVFDDVGGDPIFDLLYTPGVDGYSTVRATKNATTFSLAATKAEAGLVTERTANIAVPGLVRVVSGDAGDTTQTVRVYGLDALNVPISEVIALNGVTPVPGLLTFAKVLGAVKSAASIGTILVTDTVIPTTLFSLAPATLTRGVAIVTNAPAAGVLTVSIDVNAAVDVAVWGISSTGAAVSGRFDMTNGAAVPVVGTSAFGRIDVIALGDVAAARTVTVSVTALTASLSVYTTIQRLADYLNGKDGLTATTSVSNPTTYECTDLDAVTSQSVMGAAYEFLGDLMAIVDKITDESSYLDAAAATGATAPPANTAGAIFLTGGSEGVVSATEWQDAFDLLKTRRVNIIVPLTNDTAVHALLATHLVYRAGRGRSEANGYVGIGTSPGAGETKSNIKSQIQALGTRHISAISEECKRSNPDTLEEEWFPPFIYAALAAGMQAGSPVGEPLTRKRPFVTDVRRDSSWTVEDDAEEMIDAGLMFSEKVDALGIRWVRSITTHLADDNVVFTEMSANAAANYAVYELRRALEQRIGQRGLAGSAASIKGLAADTLNRLVNDQIIVAWRSLQVEQVGDVFPVSVEVAPVLPINFIPITVHLVAVRQTA